MKLNKILAISVIACASVGLLAGCGDPDAPAGSGMQTYVMEAEYTDMENVQGAGISNNNSGYSMIYGDGTDAEKNDKGWSSGYYVSCTYNPLCVLTFEFEASAAETATIILRLGSEIGNITLSPDIFAVALNGTAIQYSNQFIDGSKSIQDLSKVVFSDKTITTSASLVAGKNTITLSVRENTIRSGATGAPMIDCIKIQTKAQLTYTEKTENPSLRGAI